MTAVHQGSVPVSVITPVFNAAATIETTVRSVLSQHMGDLELILVDDGSRDDSPTIIRSLASEDSRIRFVLQEANTGPATARNVGLSVARGRYIAFLDSDDLWLPEKLSRQLDFMRDQDSPLTFTAYRKIRMDGSQSNVVSAPESVRYDDLLKTNSIGMLTAMYDREKVGLRLLPEIRKRQDYALWLSILRDGHEAKGLDEPLALYRIRRHSVSRNKGHAAKYQWRVYRELEHLSLMRSLWYFMHYAWNGYRKSRI